MIGDPFDQGSFVLPIRPDLVGVRSYGAPQLDVPARLNVNENPFPLAAELVDAITDSVRAVVSGLNRYPDRDATALRQALADYVGTQTPAPVGVDQVWAANGSNEVMHHLFLAFGGPGRSALTFTPTYSMYPEYARDTFTGFIDIPRDAAFSVDLAMALPAIREMRPSLVLVSSPNNPSGTALPQEDLESIAEVASALELLGRFPNLVVTRTMSKAFGLAGARLGYAVAADPSVIDVLSVVRLPYHLSAVTQAVALAALEHSEALLSQVAILRDERDQLLGWLVDHRFVVAQSDANFIMFSGFHDRDHVWRALRDQGVLIRVPEPAGWLRVSIGTPDENELFRRALLVATEEKSPTEQNTANQEGTP